MKKITIIFTCIVLLLMIVTIGISFAYFGLQIDGNDTSKVIESVSSGKATIGYARTNHQL